MDEQSMGPTSDMGLSRMCATIKSIVVTQAEAIAEPCDEAGKGRAKTQQRALGRSDCHIVSELDNLSGAGVGNLGHYRLQ